MSFPAKYRGECSDCEGVIDPGVLIVRSGDRGYRHEVCPESSLVGLRRGESPCAACYLVHAGECM